VFLLHFSVALAQTQLASQPPQSWPPLAEMNPSAPHETLRSTPTCQIDGQNPPKQVDMIFWDGEGVCGPQTL
jgi:hypothetical protein